MTKKYRVTEYKQSRSPIRSTEYKVRLSNTDHPTFSTLDNRRNYMMKSNVKLNSEVQMDTNFRAPDTPISDRSPSCLSRGSNLDPFNPFQVAQTSNPLPLRPQKNFYSPIPAHFYTEYPGILNGDFIHTNCYLSIDGLDKNEHEEDKGNISGFDEHKWPYDQPEEHKDAPTLLEHVVPLLPQIDQHFRPDLDTDTCIIVTNSGKDQIAFSMHGKYTTNDMAATDADAQLLLKIDPEADLGQYLVSKFTATLSISPHDRDQTRGIDDICSIMWNVEWYKGWNPVIDQVNLLTTVDTLNSQVYECTMKSYGMWYMKRTYKLVMYKIFLDDVLYVIERSVDNQYAYGVNANGAVLIRVIAISALGERGKVQIREFAAVNFGGIGMTESQCCQMGLKERYNFYNGIQRYFESNDDSMKQHKEIQKLRAFLTPIIPVPDPTLGSD